MATAASLAELEPPGTAPPEGVTYYNYDEFGRLTCIDERGSACDASPAAPPPSGINSWTYDSAAGY